MEPDEYNGPERRHAPQLSDEQIERIAERAATVALEQVYTQIGKSVVSKVLWVFGAAAIALVAWLGGSGHLK